MLQGVHEREAPARGGGAAGEAARDGGSRTQAVAIREDFQDVVRDLFRPRCIGCKDRPFSRVPIHRLILLAAILLGLDRWGCRGSFWIKLEGVKAPSLGSGQHVINGSECRVVVPDRGQLSSTFVGNSLWAVSLSLDPIHSCMSDSKASDARGVVALSWNIEWKSRWPPGPKVPKFGKCNWMQTAFPSFFCRCKSRVTLYHVTRVEMPNTVQRCESAAETEGDIGSIYGEGRSVQ